MKLKYVPSILAFSLVFTITDRTRACTVDDILMYDSMYEKYWKWPDASRVFYYRASLDPFPLGFLEGEQKIIYAGGLWDQYSFTISLTYSVAGSGQGELYAQYHAWTADDSAAGATEVYFSTYPTIDGFDMFFNFLSFPASQWHTGPGTSCPPNDKVSALRVSLHEMGHAIGLRHSYDCPGNIMYAVGPRGDCTHALGIIDIEAVEFLYRDFDPVADLEDTFYRDGTIHWTVSHELETAKYVVEGCNSPDGAGVVLAIEQPGLGRHSMPIDPQGFKWLRLIEIETSGRRIPKAVCLSSEPSRPDAASPVDAAVARRREEIASHVAELAASQSPLIQTVEHPTCVVYTMPAMVSVVQSQFADYWNDKGHAVHVISMPLQPNNDAAREWLKSSIRTYAENDSVKYFLLAGDWEDDFASPLWQFSDYWRDMYSDYQTTGRVPSVPPVNSYRIPPFLIPDAEGETKNTAKYWPYVYSDRPYSDINDDGAPDVVVTRWPFSSATDVAVACENMNYYDHPGIFSGGAEEAISFLVGDASSLQNGAAADITREMVGTLSDFVVGEVLGSSISTIYETDYPIYDDRNIVTKNHLNSTKPDLIAILATGSNSNSPGNFFVSSPAPGNNWDTGLLTSGWFIRAVIAASCQAAQWVPFGPDILGFNERAAYRGFLTTPDRGAIAWTGPTTGSYQNGDYLVSRLLIEELYAKPYRPMAESWLTAMQRAYAEASPEYMLTLDSFVFLGNPLSTYMRAPRHRIEAFVQKKDETFLHPMPENYAIGCPKGDWDKLIIRVSVNADDIDLPLASEDVTVSQPTSPDAVIFPDQSAIHADAAPTWYPQDPDFFNGAYRWTFTITSFSGYGEHSVPISFRGMPLDYARVKIRSPNLVLGPGVTRSQVNIIDFSDLSHGFTVYYPSSICNCAYSKLYSPCADYAPATPDNAVLLPDFSAFGGHFNHVFTSGGASPSTSGLAMSVGVLRLEFEEEQPLVGQHLVRVRVVLDGVEPFTAAVVALANENPLFRYVSWTPDPSFDGTNIGTELTRDGVKQVFLGVATPAASSGAATGLGTAEFVVDSADPVELTPQDFELVTGELLSAAGGEGVPGTGGAQQVLSLLAREITLTPPTYQNELAQNYPNPFNPTTTMAFSLAKGTDVELKIYDVRGALVKTLVQEHRAAGNHRVPWDGYNQQGNQVASGVYFYKLVAGSFVDTKKMTLLK